MIEKTVGFIIAVIIVWVSFSIIFPYFNLPNFIHKDDYSHSSSVKKTALKYRKRDKKVTLRNLFHYVDDTFYGNERKYDLTNVMQLPLTAVSDVLEKKHRFFWCHTQNKLLISLLLATGQFTLRDIEIKKTVTKSLSIHQYLVVNLHGSKYKVDPFYGVFKKI